jgi:hypothetical protein
VTLVRGVARSRRDLQRRPDDRCGRNDLDAAVLVLEHAAAAAQDAPRRDGPRQQRGLSTARTSRASRSSPEAGSSADSSRTRAAQPMQGNRSSTRFMPSASVPAL